MTDKVKEKKQGSLKNQIFAVTLIPLFILTIAIVATAKYSVDKAMISNVKKDLKETANIVLELYDQAYPGEFHIENMNQETGEFNLMKGEADIIDTNEILDDLKVAKGEDISIYIANVRVLSTLMDSESKRYIATVNKNVALAPARVDLEVYKGGAAKFYEGINLGDEECCVYYEPLYDSADQVIGMVAVAKKTAEVKSGAFVNLWPIVAVAAAGALLFAVIIITSTKKISDRLKGVEKFIGKVATGTFDNEISKNVTEKYDEITSLAQSGISMQDSIRRLVECDPLTGLNNRRFGNNKLATIRDLAERTGSPYCLGICDIDHFKRVNDTYGHEAGDEILKAVADQLKIGMGGNGYVARWGGEEFMVIFPNKTKDESEKILNNIRESIEAMETEYLDQNIKVTMSGGVTDGREGESNDDTLKRADENLYYAKEHGRNRIVAE